jgi:hypothetical protein
MQHMIGQRTVIELDYGYTCDACKKEIDTQMDYQEMLSYRNRGGFTSIFGDGTEMSLDLCQDCIKEYLGKFLQFHGNSYRAGPEPDLSKCPKCGGDADNGHDRSIPPIPYFCTKCHAQLEAGAEIFNPNAND